MAKITLKWKDKGKPKIFRFTTLPEEVKVEIGIDNPTQKVQGIGDVTAINKPGLKKISFDSCFQKNDAMNILLIATLNKAFANSVEPKDNVETIQSLMDTEAPALLDVTCDGVNEHLLVSISVFSYSEKGGAVGDIYYSIEFTEYREYGSTKVKSIPKTHTCVKGDTFAKISKKYYGNTSYKQKIADLNKMKIGAKLKVGKKVKLPQW